MRPEISPDAIDLARTALTILIADLYNGLKTPFRLTIGGYERYKHQVPYLLQGTVEIIKKNTNPTGIQEEDYWNECSPGKTERLDTALRALRWKMKIFPIDEEDLAGKIHLFPFTFGVNHEVQMIRIAHIKIIMTRDMGLLNFPKHSYHPFGY
jgi:hypothetical protein